MVLYVLAIYLTGASAAVIWDNLNAALDGRAILIVYAAYAVFSAAFLLYVVFVRKEKALAPYLAILAVGACYAFMLKFLKFPVDKIHLAEYGLLAAMAYFVMSLDIRRGSPALYLGAFAICLIAGAVDEVIQRFTPGRFFDMIDILTNAASGALVLVLIFFVFDRRCPRDN